MDRESLEYWPADVGEQPRNCHASGHFHGFGANEIPSSFPFNWYVALPTHLLVLAILHRHHGLHEPAEVVPLFGGLGPRYLRGFVACLSAAQHRLEGHRHGQFCGLSLMMLDV